MPPTIILPLNGINPERDIDTSDATHAWCSRLSIFGDSLVILRERSIILQTGAGPWRTFKVIFLKDAVERYGEYALCSGKVVYVSDQQTIVAVDLISGVSETLALKPLTEGYVFGGDGADYCVMVRVAGHDRAAALMIVPLTAAGERRRIAVYGVMSSFGVIPTQVFSAAKGVRISVYTPSKASTSVYGEDGKLVGTVEGEHTSWIPAPACPEPFGILPSPTTPCPPPPRPHLPGARSGPVAKEGLLAVVA